MSANRSRSNAPAGDTLPRFAAGLAWGAAGALPWLLGAGDPLALLAWIGIIATPAGFQRGARERSFWPYGPLAPATWMVLLVWLDAAKGGVLPSPVWAALAWTGLFAVGFALGAAFPALAWRGTCVLLLVAALATAVPVAGSPSGSSAGTEGRTLGELSPRFAARAFDLSPATLLAEAAGVDWMRSRGIYRAAGTEWFSDRRAPYRGMLAGPTLLLVGCLCLLATRRRVGSRPEPVEPARASETSRTRE